MRTLLMHPPLQGSSILIPRARTHAASLSTRIKLLVGTPVEIIAACHSQAAFD
nr:hypothetical protein [Niallia taxi]